MEKIQSSSQMHADEMCFDVDRACNGFFLHRLPIIQGRWPMCCHSERGQERMDEPAVLALAVASQSCQQRSMTTHLRMMQSLALCSLTTLLSPPPPPPDPLCFLIIQVSLNLSLALNQDRERKGERCVVRNYPGARQSKRSTLGFLWKRIEAGSPLIQRYSLLLPSGSACDMPIVTELSN